MSLQHFFLNDQVISSEMDETFRLCLTKEDIDHMKVLRLKVGEHIAVIDASQDYFECEITNIKNRDVYVRISQHLTISCSLPDVTLIQGIAKGDKMDDILRHSTELGISAFIPFESERSIVKLDSKRRASRIARWKTIVKSAAMQSGRISVPKVYDLVDLHKLEETLKAFDKVLVFWEESPDTCSLKKALEASSLEPNGDIQERPKYALVVGPEGGLSDVEVNALLVSNKNSSVVSLGPSILRTETAGIVASALVIYELGGLGNTNRQG